MEFNSPAKRQPQESIVPMINVVFLLLIFFLMTSQIAPPAPVEVTAPTAASGGEPDAENKLYVDGEGVLYFQESSGDAVIGLLQSERMNSDTLLLTADKGVEATKLAAVLRQLAAAGVPDVELVVSPK